MKHYLLLAIGIIILCSFINTTKAQSYYVRVGATGLNNGSDWTNAWTELPSDLIRGATYYLADGEYPYYNFNDPESGNEQIIIKKAVIAEHGTDIGWSDSFGDEYVQFSALEFTTSNWTFDGTSRTSKNSGHGFRIVIPGDKGSAVAEHGISVRGPMVADRIDNVKILYTEFTCGIGDYPVATQYQKKVGYYHPFGGDNTYIAYCYFHHLIGPMQKTGQQNHLIAEYNYYFDNKSYPEGSHGDAVELWGQDATDQSVPAQNCIVRYNEFHNIDGTACVSLAWGVSNMHVYGNVFYYTNDAFQSTKPLYAFKGSAGPIYVYNNTLVNWEYAVNGAAVYQIAESINPIGTKHYVYNNIWYNSKKIGVNGFDEYGYNYISNCSSYYGAFQPDATGILSSEDPFINYELNDFRLSSEIGAGKDLSKESWWDPAYDSAEDINGNIRGSDGIWDIGAYEYTESNATLVSDAMPESYFSLQNYPNPFSNSTTITFDVSKASQYSIKIYDFTGREIAVLLNGKVSAGKQQIEWNGTNSDGQQVGSGVYFYQLKTGNSLIETKKMLLLK